MTTTTLKLTASGDSARTSHMAALVSHAEALGFRVEQPARFDDRRRLVLTVRADEPVTVGDTAVTIVGLGTRKARLMVVAPRSTAITRLNRTA